MRLECDQIAFFFRSLICTGTRRNPSTWYTSRQLRHAIRSHCEGSECGIEGLRVISGVGVIQGTIDHPGADPGAIISGQSPAVASSSRKHLYGNWLKKLSFGLWIASRAVKELSAGRAGGFEGGGTSTKPTTSLTINKSTTSIKINTIKNLNNNRR